MTIPEISTDPHGGDGGRKPRIAIMGEFSVGKSTLSNLLLDQNPLPMKVTATQLPPVWMSYGDGDPFREDLDGNTHPIDLNDLESVSLEDTAVIRIFMETEILEMCDLIDMPGISDPNMAPEVWERVIQYADSVLWCTHATQAWRQSEAAVWKEMPESFRQHSLLLITRIDKLLTERDKMKVVKRVGRETAGLFGEIFPISLTQAIASGEDEDKWIASGAAAFAQSLVGLLEELSGTLGTAPLTGARLQQVTKPVQEAPLEQDAPPQNVIHIDDIQEAPKAARSPAAGAIIPSRVRVGASSGRATRRPVARPSA
ncbi:MAG: dynamin family protein [Paracoccaceae bacterium]